MFFSLHIRIHLTVSNTILTIKYLTEQSDLHLLLYVFHVIAHSLLILITHSRWFIFSMSCLLLQFVFMFSLLELQYNLWNSLISPLSQTLLLPYHFYTILDLLSELQTRTRQAFQRDDAMSPSEASSAKSDNRFLTESLLANNQQPVDMKDEVPVQSNSSASSSSSSYAPYSTIYTNEEQSKWNDSAFIERVVKIRDQLIDLFLRIFNNSTVC